MKRITFYLLAITTLVAVSAFLTSCKEDAPTPAGPSMTITTTKAVGETIQLHIYVGDDDKPDDVWIDLNNNGTKDSGEEIVDDRKYTLGAKTITIYGKVTELACAHENFTKLDVSKNTALEYLTCIDCQLTELDVSKNTALVELFCVANQLTKLDLSKNTALRMLSCSINDINEANMTALIKSLPTCPADAKGEFFPAFKDHPDEKNVYTPAHKTAAEAKNWEIFY